MMYQHNAEIWDVLDSKMNIVRTIQKGETIEDGYYHAAVEVIPTDGKGYLLVTQRSFDKKRGPGRFEFPAGSVIHGETFEQAAARELFEETGLSATKLHRLQIAKKASLHLIRITFVAVIPDLIDREIILQEGETIGYKLVTYRQWERYLITGRFDENRLLLYGAKLFEHLKEIVGTPEESEEPEIQPLKPLRRLCGDELLASLTTLTETNNTDQEENLT